MMGSFLFFVLDYSVRSAPEVSFMAESKILDFVCMF